MLYHLPDQPLTPQTFEELIAAFATLVAFLDRVKVARSLVDVNIAAGIAAEDIQHLGT